MPIYGLTDQTPALKEIGRIRKGEERQDNDYRPGSNLDYFRVTFSHDSEEMCAGRKNIFEAHYGETPREIRVNLAYDTIDACWFAWYTAYLKGGMLGMADGRQWYYLRDYRTQEVLVSRYGLTEFGKAQGAKVEFDPDEPVYYYHSERKNQDIPVFAKPEGRMSLVMPNLFGRFSVFFALTHSIHDIRQLSGELKAINEKAVALGIPLSDIPLVYSRVQQKISKPSSGGRVMADEWLCHIKPIEEWDMLASKLLERKAIYALLPKPDDAQEASGIASLVAPVMDAEAVAMLEDGSSSDLEEGAIPPGEREGKGPGLCRPYDSEVLKNKLLDFASNVDEGKFDERKRKLLVKHLNTLFGGDERRHEFLYDVFGKSSVKELAPGQVLACLKWIGVEGFYDPPAEEVIAEARLYIKRMEATNAAKENA